MTEKGVVTEVYGEEAVIAIANSEHCSGCKGCACGADGKTMRLKVRIDRKVNPGDIVTLEVNPRALVSSSLLVFILPLAMFILGALISVPVFRGAGVGFDEDTAGVITGFILMALTFATVFILENRKSRVDTLAPRIISIEKQNTVGK